MFPHKHTQVGYLILGVLGVALVYFVWIYGVIAAETSMPAFAIGVMAFVLIMLASFGTLTVSIDERQVVVKFSYGLFRKKFAVGDIASAVRVTNRWYYGWGIRLWFWPHMWIYNVSGFDAVELRMKNGRVYRIGTDEPAELEAAIKRAAHI